MERDLNSLKKDFFSNGLEIVQNIEATILKLEEDKENPEYLNSLFRSFHTLKGNSGIVGEGELNKLFHSVESKLDPIRKGKEKTTPEIVDKLLEICDLLKEIFSGEDTSSFKENIKKETIAFEQLGERKTETEKKSKKKTKKSTKPVFTSPAPPTLNISQESFKTLITSFTNILDGTENLTEENSEEKNLEILEDIATESIELRTVIIESLSQFDELNKLSLYLEQLMFLINRNVTSFDEISFEILFSIVRDLRFEMLRLIRFVPLINRIPINEISEIDDIKKLLKKDKYNIVELYIQPDLLISNAERIATVGSAIKRECKVGFLYRYSDAINKLTTFLREALDEFPVIQSNYFALLREILTTNPLEQ